MSKNLNWVCVYTNYRMENLVLKQIKESGLDVYFPKYKRTVNHARKIIEKIYPLFPRYLFVKTSHQEMFVKIKTMRGVSDYIKNKTGLPQKLSDEVIKKLKSTENNEGFINYSRFTQGQKIKINNRSIRNFKGSFLNKICKDNAQVLIEFLGREHKIITPYSSIDHII